MAQSGAVVRNPEKSFDVCARLIRSLSNSLVAERDALCALKIPKALDDPTTRDRLTREIAAMNAVANPALIRLIDFDKEESPEWFVMECHRRGTLVVNVKRYHGQIVETLQAIRPVVKG